MALSLLTLGQNALIVGLIIILSIIAFVSLVPQTGTSLILTMIFLFGGFCVTYGLFEKADIPK